MSLRAVILALLSKGPDTGYGIGRTLRHQLSYLWDARLQQIYGELAKLQSDGMLEIQRVALPNRPAKKIYSLTSAGEQALNAWLLAPPAPHICKDELLVRLFCLERLPAEVIVRRLEQRRDDCTSVAAGLRQQLSQTPRTDPQALGRLLTLESAVARAEADASWCERALSIVREAPSAQASEAGEAPALQRRAAQA